MRIIFVRHGDPDYEHDALTERGRAEAQLLNQKIKGMKIDKCFVSTMGRAKETAKLGLAGTGIEPVECEWMREFYAPVLRPDLNGGQSWVSWDWLPADWTVCDELYDCNTWSENSVMAAANVGAEYKRVCAEFEKLINENGYVREGRLYRAVCPNDDTIVFFCHLGITCVFLSYLLNVSPMILWQGLCMAPTSMTTVVTEERREGIASFRATSIGNTEHLYAAGQEPSFSGRFCELWTNADERHD